MPVLIVVVEVEALVQHNLLVGLQQAESQVDKGLVRPEMVVKLTDVHRQVFQRGLSEDGAVVAEVRGLSAVQVDLGVVGLRSAGQFGSQLPQLPVGTVDKLGAVVRLKPHRCVGAGVRQNRPRLIVDPGLVVLLHPAGHAVELAPCRGKDHSNHSEPLDTSEKVKAIIFS